EGAHMLTVIVEDDLGNRIEESIPFLIDGTSSAQTTAVSWNTDTKTVTLGEFPFDLSYEVAGAENIDSIKVYAEKNGERQHIQTLNNPRDGNQTITVKDELE